ncbi:glycoside hydrolase domain-containing protein [Pedobacter sp.]|uniref:glycoside hydrolase domain-containing protein n=1 Tax=Pedobacter sp. TaxID=1411316 RepID=UPI003BAD27CC
MNRLILAVALSLFSIVSSAQTKTSNKVLKLQDKIISTGDKKFEINADGFPKQIYNEDLSQHLLYEPMHFHFYSLPKSQEKFISNEFKVLTETVDSIVWIATSASANLKLTVKGKVFSNGLVEYRVKMAALKSIALSAINFHIPFEKSGSKYLAGLAQKTYERPDTVKWAQSDWKKIKPAFWIGDQSLGLYFRIKESSNWLKNYNGAMQINIKGSSMLTDIYASKITLNEADELNFDFNLILTPQPSEKNQLNFGRQFKLYERLDKNISKK